MPFKEGAIMCANCSEPDEHHCQTCWSCSGEPAQECCMEGWTEEAKAFERAHWAAKPSERALTPR